MLKNNFHYYSFGGISRKQKWVTLTRKPHSHFNKRTFNLPKPSVRKDVLEHLTSCIYCLIRTKRKIGIVSSLVKFKLAIKNIIC